MTTHRWDEPDDDLFEDGLSPFQIIGLGCVVIMLVSLAVICLMKM